MALGKIQNFKATLGGTDILSPLNSALKDYPNNLNKRIFILTDGEINNSEEVVKLANDFNEQARIFSFGLGDSCDKNLVKDIAIAGRGTSTIVKDGATNLNSLVIRTLTNSMELSLKDA